MDNSQLKAAAGSYRKLLKPLNPLCKFGVILPLLGAKHRHGPASRERRMDKGHDDKRSFCGISNSHKQLVQINSLFKLSIMNKSRKELVLKRMCNTMFFPFI